MNFFSNINSGKKIKKARNFHSPYVYSLNASTNSQVNTLDHLDQLRVRQMQIMINQTVRAFINFQNESYSFIDRQQLCVCDRYTEEINNYINLVNALEAFVSRDINPFIQNGQLIDNVHRDEVLINYQALGQKISNLSPMLSELKRLNSSFNN